MSDSLILIDKPTEGFAILTLNRPEKRNALSIELMHQFSSVMDELKNQRVILIKGNGSCFSSGMDLEQANDPDLLADIGNCIAKTYLSIYHSKAVTIAEVHGYAVAGGAGLMAACDFVVAEKNTMIGFPEVRIGLVPAKVMSILIRQIRRRDMIELFYRGSLIPVSRAYEMGLISIIADGMQDLSRQSHAIAQDVFLSGPEAIAHTKILMDLLSVSQFENDLLRAKNFYQGEFLPEEAKEGIEARIDKRPPRWVVKLGEK